MIDHQEEWQVFSQTGIPIEGESIKPVDSRGDPSVIVGAVHVWIWRKGATGTEILLQRRALNKPTWPDHLDISVAGHVDAGENLAEAARREAHEEVGISINSDKLQYIFSYRNFDNGIKWVYLLEQSEELHYEFNDGEVQELQWVGMAEFEEMTRDPGSFKLVPHPSEYYSWLMAALQHFS